MKAIVVTEHGGPDVLQIRELPDPVAGEDEVLIRVRAFGLNHADTYMRSGVWPFGIPVLGIEAAGTVERDPSGRLGEGLTVVAVVGEVPSKRWRRRRVEACSRPSRPGCSNSRRSPTHTG
jgi:NADPH2:quinone reductase